MATSNQIACKEKSTSKSDSGLSIRGGVRVRRRGFPDFCMCGEEVVMRTSGTEKNPGRLFHACPFGSEMDKSHFFKWTDLSMVEEIEDIKKKLKILEVDRRSSEEAVNGFQKEMENVNGEIRFFKKLLCCFWA